MKPPKDIALLTKVLEYKIEERVRTAFDEMLADLRSGERMCLSGKQREWVQRVLEEHEPQYENLISTGKAPRGREVELMVKDKPLRPPTRRVE